MDMLRYDNKPQRRRVDKPVTKAVAVQRRTEALNRRIRMGFGVFYCLAAAVVFCTAMAKTPLITGPAPQVGDVLNITTTITAPGARLAMVPARLLTGPWGHPGQGCWLDEDMMREPGGVLTVLAVRSDGVMLSWVGGDTARVASCPAPGQFLVSAADYDALKQISVARKPPTMR
jgi:hypothetical protein